MNHDLAAIAATVYVIGIVLMAFTLWMAADYTGHKGDKEDLTGTWTGRTLIAILSVGWPSTILLIALAATPPGQRWLDELSRDTKDDK